RGLRASARGSAAPARAAAPRRRSSASPTVERPSDPGAARNIMRTTSVLVCLLLVAPAAPAPATVVVPADLGELARDAIAIAAGEPAGHGKRARRARRRGAPSAAARRFRAACAHACRELAMRRRASVALLLALVVAQANPALAYLKFGTTVGGRQVTLKWSQMPVRYFVTNVSVPGVSADDFQAAVGRAFATWHAVETASISY